MKTIGSQQNFIVDKRMGKRPGGVYAYQVREGTGTDEIYFAVLCELFFCFCGETRFIHQTAPRFTYLELEWLLQYSSGLFQKRTDPGFFLRVTVFLTSTCGLILRNRIFRLSLRLIRFEGR